MAQRTDVIVGGGGTVYTFTPLTKRARTWVTKHVQLEDYQRLGNSSFAVEHRFARDLAAGMTADGLTVR